MAVYEVFSHPEYRRYKTHICSKASCVQLFCILLTFIPPLIIAFRSGGFWQKVDAYQEKPDVKFKHQLITVLETSTSGQYVTWSTYQNYNQLQMEQLRVPVVKSREDDTDRDGRNDVLHLQVDMPLDDLEEVIGVQLILIFDYRFHKFSTFIMESMGYIEYRSPVAGASLQMVADLAFQQKEPLGHKGTDTRYNTSVIDSTSIYAQDFQLPTIFKEYLQRNASTILSNQYPVWVSGRGAKKPFVIKATINYPQENVLFTPGFWQTLKWGWIQFVAILVVFIFVFDRIKIFIFQNQLVTTVIERPWGKAKLH